MTRVENIEKKLRQFYKIKKSSVTTSEEMDKKILDESRAVFEKSDKISLVEVLSSILVKIIKSNITKFAASAVIIVVVLTGIYQLTGSMDGTSVAYGMTDALGILNNAKVIHMTGWRSGTYYPIMGEENEYEKHPMELWIDRGNKRLKYTQFRRHRARRGQDAHLQKLEVIVDGDYYTEINHSTQSVSYFKLTDFWRNLKISEMYQQHLEVGFMDEKELAEFVNVDQEKIDGNTYYIWERGGDIGQLGGLDPGEITRCWVSPTTGEIKRHQHWIKWYVHLTEDEIEEKEWVQDTEWEININPVLSDDVFNTEPPEGYDLVNSKEDAPLYELNEWFFPYIGIGREQGRVALTAALPNGIVIMGWSIAKPYSNDPACKISFEDFIPGQSLPKQPIEILYGLAPETKQRSQRVIFDDTSLHYTGRHLAYSHKNGKVIEWAIYVPSQKVGTKDILPKCDIIFGMDPENRKWRHPQYGTERLNLSYLYINQKEDFDTFVLGAMAELSDSDTSPENITYESIFDLAETIRASEKY